MKQAIGINHLELRLLGGIISLFPELHADLHRAAIVISLGLDLDPVPFALDDRKAGIRPGVSRPRVRPVTVRNGLVTTGELGDRQGAVKELPINAFRVDHAGIAPFKRCIQLRIGSIKNPHPSPQVDQQLADGLEIHQSPQTIIFRALGEYFSNRIRIETGKRDS